MIIEKLRREYFFSIVLFIFVELFLILIFTFISLIFEDTFSEGLIILLLGTLGFWYFTISKIRERFKRLMKERFLVISLEHHLNYPTYIYKKIRIPLFIWGKAYLSQKRLIPKKFISLVEGNRAYPIQELREIPINNHFKILYIHKGYAALIEDVNQKKFLIHMDNLEPIK